MNFEILKELSQYLSRQKLNQVKLLGEEGENSDMTTAFYAKLREGELKNDTEAAEYFFQKKSNNKNYRQLKIRFGRHLVNAILLIDYNLVNFNPYQKANYRLIKELAAAEILFARTLHQPAVYLAEDSYKKANQFGIYEIMMRSARMLRTHYGATVFQDKKFKHYQKSYEESKKIVELEDQAQVYYGSALTYYISKRSKLELFSKMSYDYFDKLSPHLSTCPSQKFQIYSRLIRLSAQSASYDYHSMIETTEKDINYFIDNYQGNKLTMFAFIPQRAVACLRLGRYEEGLVTVKDAYEFLDSSNIGWYSIKHCEFLLYMHQGDYQAALNLYKEVSRQRRFKQLVSHMAEDWKIAGAYLAFLQEVGKLEKRGQPFKVGKLLNEVAGYSKDKQVANVPILLIYFLFLLHRGKHGQLIDEAEALEKYYQRNLRHNHALRFNIIMRMLLKIPHCSFHPTRIQAHTKKLETRLQNVPFQQNGTPFDMEILPMEKVWELALEVIEK